MFLLIIFNPKNFLDLKNNFFIIFDPSQLESKKNKKIISFFLLFTSLTFIKN
jgi:hypothetical protein